METRNGRVCVHDFFPTVFILLLDVIISFSELTVSAMEWKWQHRPGTADTKTKMDFQKMQNDV